jgi:hypothetical protein
LIRNFFRVLLVLWAGSLWSLSWVTWVIFHAQPDRHVAGLLVGPLFAIEAYLGVAVAVLGLLLPGRTRLVWGYVAAALMAVSHWALLPLLEAARTHGSTFGLSFGAWHGVSMILYLMACISVLILIWKNELSR